MSKSQDLSHARQVQSVKKTKKILRKKRQETKRSLSLESKNFIYRTLMYKREKKRIKHQKKERKKEINK